MRHQMFVRMIWRAARVRWGRAATALAAVATAATVATVLLTLYSASQSSLRNEFRNYGANIVVVAKDGASLPADAVHRIAALLPATASSVAYSYAIAEDVRHTPVVVSGTDIERAQQMNASWWSLR